MRNIPTLKDLDDAVGIDDLPHACATALAAAPPPPPPPMSAWSVKARHAPSRHRRDVRFYGHTTPAMHDIEYISPIEYTPHFPPPSPSPRREHPPFQLGHAPPQGRHLVAEMDHFLRPPSDQLVVPSPRQQHALPGPRHPLLVPPLYCRVVGTLRLRVGKGHQGKHSLGDWFSWAGQDLFRPYYTS